MVDEHNDKPATMDMGEHLRTWRQFLSLVKWSLITAAAAMLLLLMFRANG